MLYSSSIDAVIASFVILSVRQEAVHESPVCKVARSAASVDVALSQAARSVAALAAALL